MSLIRLRSLLNSSEKDDTFLTAELRYEPQSYITGEVSILSIGSYGFINQPDQSCGCFTPSANQKQQHFSSFASFVFPSDALHEDALALHVLLFVSELLSRT